jgi:hypothetical protein
MSGVIMLSATFVAEMKIHPRVKQFFCTNRDTIKTVCRNRQAVLPTKVQTI